MFPTKFPLEEIPSIQARPQDFRLLRRIEPLSGKLAPSVGDERSIVFLDTETTGLDHTKDQVIELGVVRCSYSPSEKRLTAVEGRASFLRDPGFPIPAKATEVHGITDDDVKGQAITPQDLEAWFCGDPLVVAHNAAFDRPFFDSMSAEHPLVWGCSASDIDWRGLGYEGRSLSYLCMMRGYFYGGHRALVDCEALAVLMHEDRTAFAQLLSRVEEPHWLLLAKGAPFEVKDELKKHGYRWDAARRVWLKEVAESRLEAERHLLDALYPLGGELSAIRAVDIRARFGVRQ